MVVKKIKNAAESIGDTAHTVVETVEEVIEEHVPFVGDDSPKPEMGSAGVGQPDKKTGRYRDEKGRFISREKAKAMGAAAVSESVKRTSPPEPGKAVDNLSTKPSKISMELANKNRPVRRLTLEIQDALAEADAKAEAERYQAWLEQKAVDLEYDYLKLWAEREQIEPYDPKRRQKWIERNVTGEDPNDTFDKLRREQKFQQFSDGLNLIYAGSPEARLAFLRADLIREARAQFQRQLDEGENDEEAYDELVTKRENSLQDLLIKHADKITQKQQDFIIDFSGRTYDDVIEVQEDKPVYGPHLGEPTDRTDNVSEENSDSNQGTSAQPDDDPEDSGEGTAHAAVHDSQNSGENSEADDTENDGPTEGEDADEEASSDSAGRVGFEPIPEDRALVPVENDNQREWWEISWYPEEESSEADATHTQDDGAPTDLAGADEEGENGNESESESDILAYGIEGLVKDAHPELYSEFEQAWDAYVTAQAKARYSDLVPLIDRHAKKGGWIERVRNTIDNAFRTTEYNRREASERLDDNLEEVINTALSEYSQTVSQMTALEKYQNSVLLDADAARRLEEAINRKRIEIDSNKSAVSRKVAWMKNTVGAAAVGVITGLLDGSGYGQHHLQWLTGAVITGAVIGIESDKAYRARLRSGLSEDGIEDRANEARETALSYYEGDLDAMEEKTMAVRTTEYLTNRAQDENFDRSKRAAWGGVRMAMGGAAIAAGAHMATDLLSSSDFHVPNVHLLYDNKGTDLNPFDGNGIDIWDGDKVSIDWRHGHIDPFPTGSYGQHAEITPNGSSTGGNLADAATPVIAGASEHPTASATAGGPEVNTNVIVPKDVTHPEIVATPEPANHNHGNDLSDTNGDNKVNDADMINAQGGTDTRHVNGSPSQGNDTTHSSTNETVAAGTKPKGERIYVNDEGSITGEEQEWVYQKYNIDLSDQQSYDMYHYIMKDHAPSEIFTDVGFYTLPNGDVGLIESGPAILTPVGQQAMEDWLVKHGLLNPGV